MGRARAPLLAVVLGALLGTAAAQRCDVGGKPWREMPELRFTAQQFLDGRAGETYNWAFRLCQPAQMCLNDGLIQQARQAGECSAYWDGIRSAESHPKETLLEITGFGNGWTTVAHVNIACDPSVQGIADRNRGRIDAVTDTPYQLNFSFSFASACACGQGCGPVSCTLGPTTWTAVPETRFSGQLVLEDKPQGQRLFAATPCAPSTLCSGADQAGRLQMAQPDRTCGATWTDVVSATADETGLEVVYAGRGDSWDTTARVTIKCDPAAGPALVDENRGTVVAVPAGFGNYTFQYQFRSGCACGKGCVTPSCFVGSTAWYNVPELEFTATPVIDGVPQPTVNWAFQPCGASRLCGGEGAGYLQLTNEDGGCFDFRRPTAIADVDGGVQLTFVVAESGAQENITAIATVLCDPQAASVVLDANNGRVPITTVSPGNQRAALSFKSSCACGSGCAPLP